MVTPFCIRLERSSQKGDIVVRPFFWILLARSTRNEDMMVGPFWTRLERRWACGILHIEMIRRLMCIPGYVEFLNDSKFKVPLNAAPLLRNVSL